ncbi:MAG: PEP-CTERM sorting domain-containing protein [Pirellulales bacterium]
MGSQRGVVLGKSPWWLHTLRLPLVVAATAWLAGPIAEVRADLPVQISGAFNVPAPAPVDRSSPSWPWSWLGVTTTMTASPGPVSGAIHGSSNFAFPSFPPGSLVVPSVDVGPIVYGSAFDAASIGGSSLFSGRMNFHYSIAGKKGDPGLATFSVSTAPSGTITDGAHLTPGTVSATAHDNHNGLSYGIDFPGKPFNLVGVSAGLDADMNQTQKVDWTPQVRYGYYVWANADGSLSAADSPTFVDTPDGSVLSMKFPPPPLAASTYFASFLPAVKVAIDIAQNVAPKGDLVGSLHAYAPGWSKDYAFPPLASLKLTPAASSLTYQAEFDGIQYQSIPLAGGPNQFQVIDLPTFHRNDVLVGGQLTTGEIGVPGSFVDVQGFTVGVPPPEPVIVNNTAYAPDDPALGQALGLPEAGDADMNGRVDIFDVAVLQTKYGMTSGATWSDGDFDGNGTVDIFDVAAMQVNYGHGVASSPSPVPEPSSLVLAAMGVACLLSVRSAASRRNALRQTRRRRP